MLSNLLLIFSVAFLMLFSSCGAYDIGKEILVDKPFDSARSRQDLLDAREKVKKSRREYENCLEKNREDPSKCESYKKSYEKAVEDYSSLQSE